MSYDDHVKLGKMDKSFDKETEEIIRARYIKGLDPRPVGRAIIQRKLIKLPEWATAKVKLSTWQFIDEKGERMNKKAQLDATGLFNNGIFNLFMISIIAFLAVLFFGGLMYSMHLINGVLSTVPGVTMTGVNGSTTFVNYSHAAEVTFGKATEATDGLRLVSMALIFSLILGTIVMSSFSRVHPVMWVLHLFLTVLAVIFSVPISNAYQSIIAGGGDYASYVAMHTMSNYVLVHLPITIAVVGLLGSVFMFINIVRPGNEVPL